MVKCGICDNTLDMADCVELVVIAHRGKDEVPLGSMFYHMECYLDEQSDEPSKEQKEKREKLGALPGF